MRFFKTFEFGSHGCLKNMAAHYLSPLHLCSGLIQMAYKTKRHPVRCLLFKVVEGYDVFYKNILKLN
ncbi:MAG: hypothetical protein GXO58_10935 [Thermodesulfobacteria bacterium]|nr:hypothetical protein [Thermodesulfobacteriota bacterium]